MYENNKNTKVGFSAATLRFFHRFFSLSKNILSSFFSCDGDWWFLVSVQFNGESCRKQNNNIYTDHFNPGSKGIEICSDRHTPEGRSWQILWTIFGLEPVLFSEETNLHLRMFRWQKKLELSERSEQLSGTNTSMQKTCSSGFIFFVTLWIIFKAALPFVKTHISYLTHTLSDTHPYLTFLYQFTPHGNINSDVLNIIQHQQLLK